MKYLKELCLMSSDRKTETNVNFDVGYSVMTEEKKPIFIYESPDKGKTVYSREFGSNPMNRKLIMKNGVETNERKT